MNRYILFDLVQPEYVSSLNLLVLKLQVFTHHRLIETHAPDIYLSNIADWKGEILPPYGPEAYDLFLENAVLVEDLDLVHIFYETGGRLLDNQIYRQRIGSLMTPEIKNLFNYVNSDSSIIVRFNQFIPIR